MATEFQEKLFEIIMAIPEGRVSTYGHVARAAGVGKMARYITSSIRSHERFWDLPWHRVVYADGRIWHADAENKEERIAQFKLEGVTIREDGTIEDFYDILYTFEE